MGYSPWGRKELDMTKHVPCFLCALEKNGASPMSQQVKDLPTTQVTQETRVQSLGREDALEEGMATHSSICAWRIPRTEEPAGLQADTA